MSHIYQPVMLMALLKKGDKCHEREIATDLLIHDESQIEYYTNITNNMVGRVLRNHKIVERDKATTTYSLLGYESLSADQKQQLMSLCQSRLNAFIETRGKAIYDHRRVSVGYISGTLKYEILKRARFRCELCGISADEKALEPDHILPRNHGGTDDLSNLQARHIATFFEPGQAAVNACTALMNQQKNRIESADRSVNGFNIAVNNGASARQTIAHCHMSCTPYESEADRVAELH